MSRVAFEYNSGTKQRRVWRYKSIPVFQSDPNIPMWPKTSLSKKCFLDKTLFRVESECGVALGSNLSIGHAKHAINFKLEDHIPPLRSRLITRPDANYPPKQTVFFNSQDSFHTKLEVFIEKGSAAVSCDANRTKTVWRTVEQMNSFLLKSITYTCWHFETHRP